MRCGGECDSTFVRVPSRRTVDAAALTMPAHSESSGLASAIDARSLNLPNAITLSRFVLALVLFVLISLDGYWQTAALVFVIAALTDFLDGYLARKYGQVTVLGRILDPFVDKIIICGAFIFLMAWPESGVTAWVTFTIIAREMFITQLRAFMEQRGTDFSAKWSGKIKMGFQCLAVPLCLLSLSPEFITSWKSLISEGLLFQLRDLAIWATVAITVYSGVEYSWRAFLILRRPAAE
jgi:CDP-diacylglycerol---glycerol-3-phosphate 3-phosphatidyltransferase